MVVIKKKIAVLGATGHIAKNIITGLCLKKEHEIFAYARTEAKLVEFLEAERLEVVTILDLNDFKERFFDVIINCVGIGNPQDLQQDPYKIFHLTESFDNLIIEKIRDSQETLYINFSSGAAYGEDFMKPVEYTTSNKVKINSFSTKDYYGVTKLYTEAKHRSLLMNNIVDLRVFGFFSRYIDLNSKFLMTDIINCIRTGNELVTSPSNIIRDYIHPHDLNQLIERLINNPEVNDAFDVYSKCPISKFDLLNYFKDNHQLSYRIIEGDVKSSVTGNKDNYYSEFHKAQNVGFHPQYSSIESIDDEYKYIRMRLEK
ncbi:NAD-dependent epimerase/dehydratase family protein [Paenibacillus guangzhouensis]|uniref:NAD-dependent epimerase/dehydratase family protein n=1 Tax=Paenibacillus guangzhouensis TaxID=1473112 RepID=UPI00126716D2|nr:NAD(P)-dependent oxidoreductase [Paenibacillus guangzhouensis]